MFKRGLALAAGGRPGSAAGPPMNMARVVLTASVAGLFFCLIYAAVAPGGAVSGGNGGLFCNSALRQRAERAERDAAAAASTAAALRAAARSDKAAAGADALRALGLDLVLPLTNLPLGAAALLDAAEAERAAARAGGGGGDDKKKEDEDGGGGGGKAAAAAAAERRPKPPFAARLRAAVQGQQALACASGQADPSPDMEAVAFGNVTLYVYRGNDIVSDSLSGEGHMWEEGELREFLWALRAPVPGRPHGFGEGAAAAAAAAANGDASAGAGPSPPPPLAIDIGANIGWFMINAAAAGARVAAFEAMDANVRLLRATLCANPALASRVALYATGVGEAAADCVMISGTNNRGDGHTICGEQAKDIPGLLADMKKGTGWDYESRGAMTVRRLDRMLVGSTGGADEGGGEDGGGGGGNATAGAGAAERGGGDSPEEDLETPAVVKIDIEGFEEPALRGAEGLLGDPRTRPWFVLTECNLGILKDGGRGYIRFLWSRGYAMSQESFRGPFFTEGQVEAGEAGYSGTNLYCVRRDWLGTPEGRRALGGEARWVGAPTAAQAALKTGGAKKKGRKGGAGGRRRTMMETVERTGDR